MGGKGTWLRPRALYLVEALLRFTHLGGVHCCQRLVLLSKLPRSPSFVILPRRCAPSLSNPSNRRTFNLRRALDSATTTSISSGTLRSESVRSPSSPDSRTRSSASCASPRPLIPSSIISITGTGRERFCDIGTRYERRNAKKNGQTTGFQLASQGRLRASELHRWRAP